ncbi:MAG: hypothetical protein WBA84_11315 [Carnobacterium sp.]|uniref:hypothetical protein n=1 Tax=Carnobacterium sp. TaxID=48221 RepID=UPI003C77DB68
MNQLPTLDDVVSFIKNHLKIITLTVIAGFIFYGMGLTYTIYSNHKIVSQEASQSESIDSGDLSLTQEEIDELQKDRVSFNFYVENKDATPFVNYNLLKQLLITPDVTKIIQDKAGVSIEPNPDDAINITLDSTSNILEMSIGTGNYKNNKAIADALYSAMEDESIQFFNNKSVYMSTIPVKNKKALATIEGTINLESTGISTKKIVIYGLLVIIFSTVLGVVIAIVYSTTRKEISDTFTYSYKEDDKVLSFNNFKNISTQEKNKKIVHAIIHPKGNTKLVLSETIFSEEMKNNLENELNSTSREIGIKPFTIIIIKDLSEVNPLLHIDEVIIIIKEKETTKNWYKNQRNQLENYNAPVKVIQI